jgi:hypothetical protein
MQMKPFRKRKKLKLNKLRRNFSNRTLMLLFKVL